MKISVNSPAIVAGAALFTAATLGAQTDWPTYGHDEYSTHHSPLKQIDTKNVSKLERTWTYHMLDLSTPVGVAPEPPAVPGAPAGGRGRGRGGVAPAAADQGNDALAPAAAAGRGGRGGGGQGARSEATPIVADGVMYRLIPQRRVIALIPETGKELWLYDLGNTNAATRGVEYWPGDGQSPATIFFGTTDGCLVGLNGKTGKPVPGFGVEGFVDIKAAYKGSFSLSSPPKIYKNVVITGARVQESPAIGSPGDTRGWDAHTGKLLWTSRSVPRPGEAGHDTWQRNDWVDRSGINVWGLISVDSQLGLVYLPHGSPSADFYGGDRLGDNLYGNSLVYLANVGKMHKNPNATPENKQPQYTLARSGRFWDAQKYWPCQAPPWGQMMAINVNTGERVWRVPLGVIPELEAKGVKDTGTMNMGGSLSTSGGLVFISATMDHRFRAFDAKTDKILWETELEAGAYDAPITYQGKDGKQYVAIVATGGGL